MAMNGGGANHSRSRRCEEESDINKRRDIRRNYRELISKAQRESSELTQPNSDGLCQILGDASDLFDRVTNLTNKAPTSEAVLDAQLLKTASTLGYQKAKKLHVDNKFDPTTFLEKLITYMHGRQLDDVNRTEIEEGGWSTVASAASPSFKRASGFHFMYGTFEREPPKRRVVNRNKKADEPTGPTVVPMNVKSMGKSHQEVTTEEVERMVGILHQVTKGENGDIEPIPYFDFVVNPESFSQTVENIFHLSFVLKDGHAKIELDEDDLPVIVPAVPHNEEQSGDRIQKKQVLVSIDMEQWRKLVRVFDIREPLIPTRAKVSDGDG